METPRCFTTSDAKQKNIWQYIPISITMLFIAVCGFMVAYTNDNSSNMFAFGCICCGMGFIFFVICLGAMLTEHDRALAAMLRKGSSYHHLLEEGDKLVSAAETIRNFLQEVQRNPNISKTSQQCLEEDLESCHVKMVELRRRQVKALNKIRDTNGWADKNYYGKDSTLPSDETTTA